MGGDNARCANVTAREDSPWQANALDAAPRPSGCALKDFTLTPARLGGAAMASGDSVNRLPPLPLMVCAMLLLTSTVGASDSLRPPARISYCADLPSSNVDCIEFLVRTEVLACGPQAPDVFECTVRFNALHTYTHAGTHLADCSRATLNTTIDSVLCAFTGSPSFREMEGVKTYGNLTGAQTVLEPVRLCLSASTRTQTCRDFSLVVELPDPSA